MKTNRPRGFSFVELMVTVAVLSIVLGIAVPSFNTLVQQHRVTSQTNDLLAVLTATRSEAIKNNRNIALCAAGGPDATACSTSGNWAHWIMTVGSSTTVLRRGSINTSSGIQISSTLSSNRIVFGADGLARTGTGNSPALIGANNGSLVVCSNKISTNNRRTIAVTAGGSFSTTKNSGGC